MGNLVAISLVAIGLVWFAFENAPHWLKPEPEVKVVEKTIPDPRLDILREEVDALKKACDQRGLWEVVDTLGKKYEALDLAQKNLKPHVTVQMPAALDVKVATPVEVVSKNPVTIETKKPIKAITRQVTPPLKVISKVKKQLDGLSK